MCDLVISEAADHYLWAASKAVLRNWVCEMSSWSERDLMMESQGELDLFYKAYSHKPRRMHNTDTVNLQ